MSTGNNDSTVHYWAAAFRPDAPGCAQVLSTWLLSFPAANVQPALQLSKAELKKLNATAYGAITPVARV